MYRLVFRLSTKDFVPINLELTISAISIRGLMHRTLERETTAMLTRMPTKPRKTITLKGGLVRQISTMRDLARFVNKDALSPSLLQCGPSLCCRVAAKWNQGNPYGDNAPPAFGNREAGFRDALGGPHILALVSEVATRALKVVWHQKWQAHLRLRPEAYGGLVHVQNIGVGSKKLKRNYGLPAWLSKTSAAQLIQKQYKSLLLPMAFTPGSPNSPGLRCRACNSSWRLRHDS